MLQISWKSEMTSAIGLMLTNERTNQLTDVTDHNISLWRYQGIAQQIIAEHFVLEYNVCCLNIKIFVIFCFNPTPYLRGG